MNNLALNTKVRAMFSEHFILEDYLKFTSLNSLDQLLNAFEENRRYKEVTYNLHNHEFRRDELEEDIRLIIPREYRKLKRFSSKNEIDPYLVDKEREIITNKLYSLYYGTPFVLDRTSIELTDYIPYSLHTISQIDSIEALKKHLRKSVFYDYLKTYEENKPFWRSELELWIYQYKYLLDRTHKKHKSLHKLISKTFLFKTFMIIEGLRKLDVESIQHFLNMLPSKIDTLSKDELRNFLAGNDYVGNILRYLQIDDKNISIDEAVLYRSYHMYQKVIRLEQDSTALLYAYLGLDDIEIQLMTRVIENIRYNHRITFIYEWIFNKEGGS